MILYLCACRAVETKYANGSTTAAATAAADEELDNPFQADGELRRKADYIITHSRISRTEIQIADPDSPSSVPSSRAEVQLPSFCYPSPLPPPRL